MGDTSNTRDRILDVALDLFTEQGFDKTSLREIAERLDITKAALYYHFPSKNEILGALADRLFSEVFAQDESYERYREEGFSLDLWAEAVDHMVDRLLGNRKLFLMFQRNQAAFESLAHEKDRFKQHEEREAQLREILTDESVPFDDRVRYAASIGAVFFAATQTAEAFADVPVEEMRRALLGGVHDLLGLPRRSARRATKSKRATSGAA